MDAETIFTSCVLVVNIIVLCAIIWMQRRTSQRIAHMMAESATPSLVGRLGMVTTEFGPTTVGAVRVGDEEIAARSRDTTSIFRVGDTVKVREVIDDGNTVRVCHERGWI
ncbi:MAG: NfeD family protein [Candidatus Saccharimonas sp.]